MAPPRGLWLSPQQAGSSNIVGVDVTPLARMLVKTEPAQPEAHLAQLRIGHPFSFVDGQMTR